MLPSWSATSGIIHRSQVFCRTVGFDMIPGSSPASHDAASSTDVAHAGSCRPDCSIRSRPPATTGAPALRGTPRCDLAHRWHTVATATPPHTRTWAAAEAAAALEIAGKKARRRHPPITHNRHW